MGNIKGKITIDELSSDLKNKIKTVDDIKDGIDSSKVSVISSNFNGEKLNEVLEELFTNADNAQKEISNIIGSPLSANDNLQIQKEKIMLLKNNMSAKLTSKGVSANNTESINSLVNKISNIKQGDYSINDTIDIENIVGKPFILSKTYKEYAHEGSYWSIYNCLNYENFFIYNENKFKIYIPTTISTIHNKSVTTIFKAGTDTIATVDLLHEGSSIFTIYNMNAEKICERTVNASIYKDYISYESEFRRYILSDTYFKKVYDEHTGAEKNYYDSPKSVIPSNRWWEVLRYNNYLYHYGTENDKLIINKYDLSGNKILSKEINNVTCPNLKLFEWKENIILYSGISCIYILNPNLEIIDSFEKPNDGSNYLCGYVNSIFYLRYRRELHVYKSNTLVATHKDFFEAGDNISSGSSVERIVNNKLYDMRKDSLIIYEKFFKILK